VVAARRARARGPDGARSSAGVGTAPPVGAGLSGAERAQPGAGVAAIRWAERRRTNPEVAAVPPVRARVRSAQRAQPGAGVAAIRWADRRRTNPEVAGVPPVRPRVRSAQRAQPAADAAITWTHRRKTSPRLAAVPPVRPRVRSAQRAQPGAGVAAVAARGTGVCRGGRRRRRDEIGAGPASPTAAMARGTAVCRSGRRRDEIRAGPASPTAAATVRGSRRIGGGPAGSKREDGPGRRTRARGRRGDHFLPARPLQPALPLLGRRRVARRRGIGGRRRLRRPRTTPFEPRMSSHSALPSRSSDGE
jgi:hypothetical protein